MPSVKISDLPVLNELSANNANTIFVAVDKTTNTTSQFSTTTLAAGLFANNILNVGTELASDFSGLIAQFVANTASYGQVNFENANTEASMDIVITADIGDDANNFLDLGLNNSGFNDPQYSSMKGADGYLFVNGGEGNDYVGNLVIGTTAAETKVLFSIGGTTNLDVVAKMTKNGLDFDNGGYITFDNESTQYVAAAPANYTQSAFDAANTVVSSIVVIQGVNTTQNTRLNSIESINSNQNNNITLVNQFAAGAYSKANAAVANTTSINLPGDLNVTSNVTVGGFVDIISSTFPTNQAFVQINAANNGAFVAPSNTNYMLHVTGKANSVTRVVVDSFGANTYPLLSGRMGRGSAASPAATSNNDVLMRIVGNGYTGTQFPSSSPAKIDFVATQNFSDVNRGTSIEFWNTPNNSNTIQRIASFSANSVEFTGTIIPQGGFVYSANTYPGLQTAIGISFSAGPVYRASLDNDLTVTLTNFVAGKAVELWLTNTAGAGRTFTHGVSSTNSTTNTTSYNIPSTSTIYVKYYCIDGTLANTFVAVTHN